MAMRRLAQAHTLPPAQVLGLLALGTLLCNCLGPAAAAAAASAGCEAPLGGLAGGAGGAPLPAASALATDGGGAHALPPAADVFGLAGRAVAVSAPVSRG
jgi:hypothetical protein